MAIRTIASPAIRFLRALRKALWFEHDFFETWWPAMTNLFAD